MFTILVSDKLGQAGLDILEAAEDTDFIVKTGLSEEELISEIGSYDGLIIRSGTTVSEAVLSAASKLKVVGRAGVGVDNVDIEAAARKGVIVMNTPTANTVATAELALTLMLSVSRNVVSSHNNVASGKWDRSSFAGQELAGKTLGIVGFGRVGKAVSVRAQAFGMDVCVYDPYVNETVAKDLAVDLVELDDLLRVSDYVSLHSVLNEETKHLINAERLGLMKDSAILVNVARGGLVDAGAVVAALDAGTLQGAGVDVFEQEPPTTENPLVAHPKVVHTPHLGASTAEAQRGVAIDVANQVLDALRGEKISNPVNLGFSGSVGFDRLAPYIELAEGIGLLQSVMADSPIQSVEVEIVSDQADDLLRPVAAGLLKGLMEEGYEGNLNYVNAPLVGEDRGLEITRSVGLGDTNRQNMVTCRVKWDEGERTVSGMVYEDDLKRIVRVSNYRFEADPQGTVLLLLNDDVPGVIGSVGVALGELGVNVAEWRLGRNSDRAEALSFINLDAPLKKSDLDAIAGLDSIKKVVVVDF